MPASVLGEFLNYFGPFVLPFVIPIILTLAFAAAVGVVFALVRLWKGKKR